MPSTPTQPLSPLSPNQVKNPTTPKQQTIERSPIANTEASTKSKTSLKTVHSQNQIAQMVQSKAK